MRQKSQEHSQKRSNLLNWFFATAIAVVAGGIAWVGWNCIDSVDKNTRRLKNFHVTKENTQINSHRYDTVNKELDTKIFSNQIDPEQALQEAVFNLKGSEISFSKGLTALGNGEYARAELNFSNVLKRIPMEEKGKSSWRAWRDLYGKREYTSCAYQERALCYIQTGQYAKAVSDLNEAIKLRPDYAQNYENRGKAYLKLGQKALGASDLRRAKALANGP